MRRLPTLSLIAVTVGSLWLMAADVPPGSRTAVTTPVSGLNAAGRSIPVRMSDAGGVSVELVDSTGASTGTAAAPLRTDPTGTTTQPVSISPDGGSVPTSQVTMVSSEPCIEVTATQVPDGGTAAVTAGAQYRYSVYGDSSGNRAGCWSYTQPTTCTAKNPLNDGDRNVWGSWSGPLYFLSASTTTMTVSICPATPSR